MPGGRQGNVRLFSSVFLDFLQKELDNLNIHINIIKEGGE